MTPPEACTHENAEWMGYYSLVGKYRCNDCGTEIDPVEYHRMHMLPHIQLSAEHNRKAMERIRTSTDDPCT